MQQLEVRMRGSWAESSATYFSRQKPSPQDIVDWERVRTEFRQLCVRHYGSLIGAWKAMDVNSDGRLSYFEFLRACKHMQVSNARAVWSALGRSGFVSLQELDPVLAQQLGVLATKLWSLCGSVEEAWRHCFNRASRLRVSRDDFVQACEGLGFKHGEACFTELCSEKARTGMSRKEFGFLHTWMGRGPDRGFIDPPPSRWEKERRPWTPPQPVLKKFERRKKFKDCLLRSYGNFVRAWREGLDRDHNDKLDYHEFSAAVKDVGYPGNPRELWEELDANHNGYVSLWELDQPTAELLKAFVDSALASAGTWRSFWSELLDIRCDDRVRLAEFRDACTLIAFDGDVDTLFELLDTDKTRYLTWATTSWLSSAELDEEEEDQEDEYPDFMKPTKSQRRLAHNKARDHRVRVKRFEGRARGEIPGSHTAAGTTIYANRSTLHTPAPEPAQLAPSSSAPGLAQASVFTNQSISSQSAWTATAAGTATDFLGKNEPCVPDQLALPEVPRRAD
ncbi:USP20 [Symbiodinium natans]|uniref:USP20 protein n=1 Tax=Symbiodinium natans TaxID=878477 RepID=A0A812R9M9_9DINO|nr:USP20 [Symbiodinium natans]